MTAIKICGVTSVDDALTCVEAGADAIGLNFYRGSRRYVDPAGALLVVDAVGSAALTVGVFVDASYDEIESVRQRTGIACVQLHGDEPPDLVQRFLPHAYKALRVRGSQTIDEARRYPGEYLMLDAYVAGEPGGTGTRFDWSLAEPLARERKVALAGGLTPDNVAQAIEEVRPFCVDVAGGVERAPGEKDPARVRAFIRAVRELG